MKSRQLIIPQPIVWTLIATAVLAAAIAIFVLNKQGQPDAISADNNYSKTVVFEVDHKTYSSLRDLREESDVVIRGSVLDDGSTRQEDSIGASADGQPAPGLVNTEFSVRVDTSLKGGIVQGTTILVVLTGGVINDTKYVSDGMPWLKRGDSAIIYLSKGEDGKYYPMAGGAAIASKVVDTNTFSLPGKVSGKDPIRISETEF